MAARRRKKQSPPLIRSNALAGLVGFLCAQGRSSTQIEAILGGRVPADGIRAYWRRWGLSVLSARGGARSGGVIGVVLSRHWRNKVQKRAEGIGLPPDEWARRVAVAAIRDDLYAMITDGKYDPAPAGAEDDTRRPEEPRLSRGRLGRTAADREFAARG